MNHKRSDRETFREVSDLLRGLVHQETTAKHHARASLQQSDLATIASASQSHQDTPVNLLKSSTTDQARFLVEQSTSMIPIDEEALAEQQRD